MNNLSSLPLMGKPPNYQNQPQLDGAFLNQSHQNLSVPDPNQTNFGSHGQTTGYNNPFSQPTHSSHTNTNQTNSPGKQNPQTNQQVTASQQQNYQQPFQVQANTLVTQHLNTQGSNTHTNPIQGTNQHNATQSDQQKLELFRSQITKASITDIEKHFTHTQTMPGGLVTLAKNDFINFLQTPQILFSKQDAEEFTNKYLTHSGSDKLNLTQLKKDLAALLPQIDPLQAQNHIFEGLKKYLAINGGNLLFKFKECDAYGDMTVQREEFKTVLQGLNTCEVYDENTINALIPTLDPQNTNIINYIAFLKSFYQYANEKMISQTTDPIYPVLEGIRKMIKTQRKSLAQIFIQNLINNQKLKDVYLDFQTFKSYLQFANIKVDYMMEQRLFIKLDKAKNSQVDFYYLADLIGFEPEDFASFESQTNANQQFGQHQPNQIGQNDQFYQSQSHLGYSTSGMQMGRPQTGMMDTQKFGMMGGAMLGRDQRRLFYRTFARHIKLSGLTAKYLEQQMGSQALENPQLIPMSTFKNNLLSFCHGSQLFHQQNIIENIAKDYDKNNTGNANFVDFCNKVQMESEKLALLEQFYWKMKEALDFRGSQDLYDLLQAFDNKRDKRFYAPEIEKIFQSKAMSINQIELDYVFDEYDPKGLKYIEYNELDRDFREFAKYFETHRNVHQHTTNLNQILYMIQSYCNSTGKSLRDVFKKTRPGESDYISKFDFTKIMTDICYQNIDSDSIDRLAQELDPDAKNNVSFSELLKRYNAFFNIKEDVYDHQFKAANEAKIIWHIASICFNQKNKLSLESHFHSPSCPASQFIGDLERDPFQCHKLVMKDQLQGLADSYRQGSYVNSGAFVNEIQQKVDKLVTRQNVFRSLKQHLTFRGSTIEEIFLNIKGLGKYKDENLAPEEFYAVFLSVEFKIDKQQLWDILDTMNKDSEGKVSYKEFQDEYKRVYENKSVIGGGVQGLKYFQNPNEITPHIAQLVQKKGVSKTLGNHLAGYDIHQTGVIERDSFYRVIESMGFGLGEGDIQALLKIYDQLNRNQIVLKKFVDDLNSYIHDRDQQIVLKSDIGQTINERIVEPLTPTPKQPNQMSDKNFQATVFNMKIIRDIVCGLYVKNKDIKDLLPWFSSFSKQTQGHLTQNEFYDALDSLQVEASAMDRQQFVDNIMIKQEPVLGHKSTNINIEYLMQSFTRDFKQNKDQMMHEILFDIGESLTQSKIPLKDQFLMQDTNSLGFLLRDAFSGNILDNYLGLRSILTKNRKELLMQKYDPDHSFRIHYDQFIGDLKRIEIENSSMIKIYLSYDELKHDEQINSQQNQSQINESNVIQEQAQLDAQSKKNTVFNDHSLAQGIQMPPSIPNYEYEDIMLATYKRGKSIEGYFRDFGKYQNRDLIVDIEQFYEALKKLSIKWTDRTRVTDLYEAMDQAAHHSYTRTLTPDEIGNVIFNNCVVTIDEIQSRYLQVIYNLLKQKQQLQNIKDIFGTFNTRRDNTCLAKDFKSVIMDQLNLKQNGTVTETMIEVLVQRYKLTSMDSTRIVFSKFLKDLEMWDKGISPMLSWATEFAEDIIKALVIFDYQSIDQYFSRFQRLQGIILFEEFQKAIHDLSLGIYHDESQQREFFINIDQQSGRVPLGGGVVGGGQARQGQMVNKVSLNALIDTIKKLCSKTSSQMGQEILEKIYVQSKTLNTSMQVYNIFNEFDPQKTGYVSIQDFKQAIETKFNNQDIKQMDLDFLAQKYKASKSGPSGMIQYEKFFQDYDRIEKLGVKASDNPFKPKQQQPSQSSTQPIPIQLPKQSQDLYKNMGNHILKMDKTNNTDQLGALSDELVKKDIEKKGFLSETQIYEAFTLINIKLSRGRKSKDSQMDFLTLPLPQYNGTYNYIAMLELLFGKESTQQLLLKHNMQQSVASQIQLQSDPLIMQDRFKDQIELRLIPLQSYVQQITKGSWQLREQEFYMVFNKASIICSQKDVELLQLFFRKNFNKQTQAIDFRVFTQTFQISDIPSKVFSTLEREIYQKKLNLQDLFKEDEIPFDQFIKVLNQNKVETSQFSNDQWHSVFRQMSGGRDSIEKNELIRMFGSQLQKHIEESIPFIVNEVVFHIINQNKDIFKVVNPQVKIISKQQFQQLLTNIGYKPTKPNELSQLFDHLSAKGYPDQVSLEKLVQSIRKIDPQYGALATNYSNNQMASQQTNNKVDLKNAKTAQIQLQQFNPKIKKTLQTISTHFKKQNISTPQLYKTIDKNGNGLCEKEEFISAFQNDIKVQGILRADLEQVYDALDSNKDGYLSINEFCLYLEGTQLSMEQKLKTVDVALEKEIMIEIESLFQRFDQNGDGKVTTEEVMQALKSVNQQITLKDAQDMVAFADKNHNGFLEKGEFVGLMMPKLKEEMLLFENNLDELRRMFKEADHDQNNYLNKQELQSVLVKQGVELSEVQLNDLFSELDVDLNGYIDIDEFIAYLSIADQLKFKNPNSKVALIRIRRARKLHPIDFFNCFKDLPAFFTPSFTQPFLEKRYKHAPSEGIYPEFDSKSMTFKDLNKLGEYGKQSVPTKKFIEVYSSQICCEIQLEEVTGVPLPKNSDFDWSKINNREIRAILFDNQTQEYLSNTFILSASWKQEFSSKWLFNTNQNHINARNFIVKANAINKQQGRDLHILFELVLYTLQQDQLRQISCGWGTLPLINLDKASKLKVQLRGGSPSQQQDIDMTGIHQEKKGFSFLKKTVASQLDFYISLNIKPSVKFSEQTLLNLAMLPENCLIPRRLVSFVAAFRLYCFKNLTKAQQQMITPQGNFVIAQFRKIYDNPDTNMMIGDCWDAENQQVVNIEQLMTKMEDYIYKLYSVIYSAEYEFNHVYPMRSHPIDSEIYIKRENIVKQLLIPGKFKPQKLPGKQTGSQQNKVEVDYIEDYKPFNIQEMEVEICGIDTLEAKQDEIMKMYMKMGLIQ